MSLPFCLPRRKWFCLFLCSCLFLITPLYYLSLPAKGNWKEQTPPLLESIAREIFSFPLQNMEGFIPVRTVNAEYKLVVFLALASVVTGIVFCALHLKKHILRIPRPLLLFGGLFLGSVFLSSVFAHNFQRVGLFPSLALGSRSLCSFLGSRSLDKKKKTAFCLGSLLTGGIVSCLVVNGSTLSMDGVESWTPENGTRRIDLQQEFCRRIPCSASSSCTRTYVLRSFQRVQNSSWAWSYSRFFTRTDAFSGPGGMGWLDGRLPVITVLLFGVVWAF